MIFQGYELRVLINNIVLEEYRGPRKNLPYRYSSPDWVDNSQTGIRMESEFLHYILISPSSTQFTVQVSSLEASYFKPIVAEIRINGIPIHEQTTSFFPSSSDPKGLSLTDSGKKPQICMLNKLENHEQQLIGAISVFFYKAETLLQKKSEIPLAVLHLHYRSKDMYMKLIQDKVLNIEYFEGNDDLNYIENEDFNIKEEINSSSQIIKLEARNNTYVFGEEPLGQFQNNEQLRYNDNEESQSNIWEQSRNVEIIEIPDD
ncbi:hypothetical protein C1645_807954 [Glomus cerebriforme]|uniref:Uncharacterized protein n=1 Tax=Glomus cerebriforme TaxID=658196 RepID=A0A397STR8_9GLOM|nr:hypothetical protein C1645_807954 [Glomus cerebriforme]